MKTWSVSMPAHCSFTVFVKAETAEEAVAEANDTFEGMKVPGVCHQCSGVIDEVFVGAADETNSVDEVTDDKDIKDAEKWIAHNS